MFRKGKLDKKKDRAAEKAYNAKKIDPNNFFCTKCDDIVYCKEEMGVNKNGTLSTKCKRHYEIYRRVEEKRGKIVR